MNEHELRDALRGIVVAGSPPPSMSPAAALEAARSARRRRRATIGYTGTAVAVVAVAVGALIAAGPGQSGTTLPIGAPPGSSDTKTPYPPSSNSGTETPWPSGQQDRTATNGPRADQGVALESALSTAIPAGYTVLPDNAPGQNFPLKWHQAEFEDRVNGAEVWRYDSRLPITKGGKTGILFSEVLTPGNTLPAGLCDAAKTLWGSYTQNGQVDQGWQCQEQTVGGKKVGVISGYNKNDSSSFDQWAFYRHADGTGVFIAQAKQIRSLDGTLPGLDAEPLTLDQLAALATDPKFHLS